MRFGIVRFPGSNCDADCQRAITAGLGQEAVYLWHQTRSLEGVDVILLPGGFSYGDHLRAGAIARLSPIMREVIAFARNGGPVVGICNGFQILCEAHLLPGALIRNRGLRFRHIDVHLRIAQTESVLTRACSDGQVLRMPIAHGEGQFVADETMLGQLESQGRVVFRYVDRHGNRTTTANPNGSQNDIAGICNEHGNIVGLMPHPERAISALLGGSDGLELLRSLELSVSETVVS